MKARYRIKRGLFGRSSVVLQVGYERNISYFCISPLSLGSEWIWRDATEEDLLNRALHTVPGPAKEAVTELLDRF